MLFYGRDGVLVLRVFGFLKGEEGYGVGKRKGSSGVFRRRVGKSRNLW